MIPAAAQEHEYAVDFGITPSSSRPAETTKTPPHDPFSRIIGQRRAVPFLKEIRDGICLGAHPRPLLFLGRSGHGKTALSKAYADSIGAEFVRIDCGPELKSENLVERLIGLKSLAVVFCDEMQSMRKRVQEILYSAIDASLVPALTRGRLDRCAEPVAIVPFVLIGATNEPGRLLPALRARMVTVVMDDYTDDDLRAIAIQKATQFFLQLSSRAIDLVVRASGGSPRTIVQILQSIEVTSASWRFNYELETTNAELAGDATGDQGSDEQVDSLAGIQAGIQSEEGAAHIGSLVGDFLGDFPLGHEAQTARGGALAAFSGACLPASVPCIPDDLVERALSWMGLDLYGLDATGRTLLATMAQHGRATAELLSTVIGLDIPFTRQALAELRARQFTQAAPGRGWVLTETGKHLVKELGLGS